MKNTGVPAELKLMNDAVEIWDATCASGVWTEGGANMAFVGAEPINTLILPRARATTLQVKSLCMKLPNQGGGKP
jgi:hypothetical protein